MICLSGIEYLENTLEQKLEGIIKKSKPITYHDSKRPWLAAQVRPYISETLYCAYIFKDVETGKDILYTMEQINELSEQILKHFKGSKFREIRQDDVSLHSLAIESLIANLEILKKHEEYLKEEGVEFHEGWDTSKNSYYRKLLGRANKEGLVFVVKDCELESPTKGTHIDNFGDVFIGSVSEFEKFGL